MRKLYVVASREYLAAVKTKAFLIGLLVMPVMMGGSVLVQWFIKDVRDVKDKHFAVINRTSEHKLYTDLEARVQVYNTKETTDHTGKQIRPRFILHEVKPSAEEAEQRFELSEQVRKGELFGFLDIGPDVLTAEPVFSDPRAGPPPGVSDRAQVRYHSNRATYLDFANLAGGVVSLVAQERRAKALKIKDVDELKKAMQPVPLVSMGLVKSDLKDPSAQNQAAAFLIPFILVLLMFMVIMTGATPLMQGIVEEKMQRIAEVLLGSVSPFQLMLGKLLGMTAVSLTMGGVYLVAVYWSAQHFDFAEYVSPGLLVWFLVFQSLAALMYGTLFIAIGAACSDMKETQSLLLPVMLIACLPMFVIMNVIQEPNGPVATGLSFFPFATPMLIVARLAIPGGIPWWQPIAGVLLVLATTVLCVWVAGRIFRVGILMQGKGARLGEMARWVLRG